MKSVKRISLVVVIFAIIMSVFSSTSYAALSASATLTPSKTEVTAGEEFTVRFNISNIQGDKGVIALSGTLKYDKNLLELVSGNDKIVGSNTWGTPSLNEANGKFVIERSGLGKVDETVFTVKFKAKNNVSGNAAISVEDILISDGDVEESVSKVSKTITIKAKEQTSSGNKEGEVTNIPTSSTNKNQSTNKTTTLPKTGESNFVIIAGGCGAILSIIAFVFYKKSKLYRD